MASERRVLGRARSPQWWMQMPPSIRYAKSGDVHIVYRAVGEGPIDLVVVPGWVSHLEASLGRVAGCAFRRAPRSSAGSPFSTNVARACRTRCPWTNYVPPALFC